MASTDARDAELARLSGSGLVEHLRTTCRRADYEAAARVLDARDARLARAEAALAKAEEDQEARDGSFSQMRESLARAEAELAEAKEGKEARDHICSQMQASQVGALRTEYDAFKAAMREKRDALMDASPGLVSEGASRGPRDEPVRPGDAIAASARAPSGECRAKIAEKGPVFVDLCSSDDDDEGKGSRGKVSEVSRKRKATASVVSEEGRRARAPCKWNDATSACSSDDEDDTLTLSQHMKKKRDAAQPGADVEPKNSKNADSVQPSGDYLPEESLVAKEEVIEAAVVDSNDPIVVNFVQGTGNVKSEEDGGMSMAMPSPQPLCSAVARANSAGPFGIDQPGISLTIKKEAIKAAVDGSDETKVANLVQERGNVKSVDNSGAFREIFSPSPPGFSARKPRTGSQKNFSKADHLKVRISGKEGSMGNDLPKTPVITEGLEIRFGECKESKVAAFVRGRGNGKSADNGGVSRAMFSPLTSSQKNSSKADHGGPRIDGKGDSFAAQEADTFSQVKNSSLSARKIVESMRAGAVSPKGHTGSALGGNMALGLEALRNKDKQLGSSTLLIKSELHSGETSVEGSLPAAVTRNWKYETSLYTSCIKSKEICLQAACALYRQKKLIFQPTNGGRSSGICKSDEHRFAKLVEFLLDGNVQGPLKRTVEELVNHDSTGPVFLEQVVCQFYNQLFAIYKNKEDPYFR